MVLSLTEVYEQAAVGGQLLERLAVHHHCAGSLPGGQLLGLLACRHHCADYHFISCLLRRYTSSSSWLGMPELFGCTKLGLVKHFSLGGRNASTDVQERIRRVVLVQL